MEGDGGGGGKGVGGGGGGWRIYYARIRMKRPSVRPFSKVGPPLPRINTDYTLFSFHPVCPTVSGYTSHQGVDHNGADILNVFSGTKQSLSSSTINLLATACRNQCQCVAFNSAGWLKTSASFYPVANAMCFYTANNPVACSPPRSPGVVWGYQS